MNNTKQKKLLNENSLETTNDKIENIDYYKICYKLVSSKKNISSNKENNHLNKNQKKSLLNVLNSFNQSKKVDLEKINMKLNSKMFVKKIYETYSDEYIQMLINDFSEDMNTNMKEKDKYVVLIIVENQIILAHTKIGETSINTEFSIFERLLDKDNVMRIVFFEKNEETINVSHYEKNKSKFFTKWLGIDNNKIFYSFGGENKFYSEIYGCSIMLELTDEELDKIKLNKYISIKNNSIYFNEQINNLKIKHVMRNNKKFNNYELFEEDFLSRKYELKYYQKEYIKLLESLDPIISKIYDDEWEIRKNDNVILEKKNKNIHMLFCNNKIEITNSYLRKIISAVLNNEPFKITHLGDNFSKNPIKIGNIELYNQYNLNLTQPIIKYLNDNKLNFEFKKELIYVIFNNIKFENPNSSLTTFITKFLKKFEEELIFDSITNENEIIELKTKDYFTGKNKNIVEKMSEDINKKLEKNNFKIYIIGYNEKNKTYDPLSSQPFNDDRILDLKNQILEKSIVSNLNLIKLPYDQNNCIIYCTVK